MGKGQLEMTPFLFKPLQVEIISQDMSIEYFLSSVSQEFQVTEEQLTRLSSDFSPNFKVCFIHSCLKKELLQNPFVRNFHVLVAKSRQWFWNFGKKPGIYFSAHQPGNAVREDKMGPAWTTGSVPLRMSPVGQCPCTLFCCSFHSHNSISSSAMIVPQNEIPEEAQWGPIDRLSLPFFHSPSKKTI